MGKNNLNSFYEKIAQDKELQSRVKPIIEKMKDSKNLDEIFRNELIPVAKNYGFELTLKDFLDQEAESKKSLSLDELENVSGGVAVKPLMFTALTLFGLLGTGATAMQAHAADVLSQVEVIELSDSSDDDNMYQQNDNGAEAERNENGNSSVSENCVATINGQEYKSLIAAIFGAKDGDTIRIEKDIEISSSIRIYNKNITIVANGEKTIRRNGFNDGNMFTVYKGTLNIGDDNAQNRLIIDGGNKNAKCLIQADDSNLNIKNAKLCNNNAGRETDDGAGAIEANGGKTTISQTEICNNSSSNSGGAMSFSNAEVNLDNVKIYDNSSFVSAGGVKLVKSTFNVSGQFEAYNNFSNSYGGFMSADRESKISLNGQGEIYNNKGKMDGAFLLEDEGIIDINGQFNIHDNKARERVIIKMGYDN